MRVLLGAPVLATVLGACSPTGADAPSRAVTPPEAAAATPSTSQSDLRPQAPSDPQSDLRPAAPSNAQSQPRPVAPATDRFDSSRAYEHLRRQVAFGPRPAGSAALERTRRYILEQLEAAGIEAREDAFDAQTPVGTIRMVNVIATIPGRRAERIALATHYDTKRMPFRFVGASDGASSTAVVLEAGRVLAAGSHEYTIELIFFDGEEAVVEWVGDDNTYGSRHYVEQAKHSGTLETLEALVLLDMIGDRDLNIRRESNSTAWLTDVIWASAEKLGYGRHFLDEEFAIGGDDHFPFLAAGVPAVDVIDFDYPAWHTPQDDLDRVSARSLQIVGETVLAAWPDIERAIAARR